MGCTLPCQLYEAFVFITILDLICTVSGACTKAIINFVIIFNVCFLQVAQVPPTLPGGYGPGMQVHRDAVPSQQQQQHLHQQQMMQQHQQQQQQQQPHSTTPGTPPISSMAPATIQSGPTLQTQESYGELKFLNHIQFLNLIQHNSADAGHSVKQSRCLCAKLFCTYCPCLLGTYCTSPISCDFMDYISSLQYCSINCKG